jgi:hypothetical protein
LCDAQLRLRHRRRLGRAELRAKKSLQILSLPVHCSQLTIDTFLKPGTAKTVQRRLYDRLDQMSQEQRTTQARLLEARAELQAAKAQRAVEYAVRRAAEKRLARAALREQKLKEQLTALEDLAAAMPELTAKQNLTGLQEKILRALDPDLVAPGQTANTIFPRLLANSLNRLAAPNPQGIRDDPEVREFCLFIFNIGGRRCYEVLAKALYLPGVSCIDRARREVTAVQEGVSDRALDISIGLIKQVFSARAFYATLLIILTFGRVYIHGHVRNNATCACRYSQYWQYISYIVNIGNILSILTIYCQYCLSIEHACSCLVRVSCTCFPLH